MKRTGPDEKTRLLLLDSRAGRRCERCDRALFILGYSLQHRRARGMGGTRRANTNSPQNLAVLCGSATTPAGCHQWVESHPQEALIEGWRVPQSVTHPGRIPIKHAIHGMVYLTVTGDYTFHQPKEQAHV